MVIKTRQPTGTKKYFNDKYLGKGFPYNGTHTIPITKKAESVFYTLVGGGSSGWELTNNVYWPGSNNFTADEYKKVEIVIPIRNVVSGFIFDTYFDFEGIKYSNSTSLEGDNIYIKSGDAINVALSIFNCFYNIGLDVDWDFYYSKRVENSNIEVISIYLTRLKKGDYKISSNMKMLEDVKRNIYINNECNVISVPVSPNYTGHHITGTWVPGNYFDYLSPNFKSMIIEEYSLSNESIDNYSYYDFRCSIIPSRGFGYSGDIYNITSISDGVPLIKKNIDIPDFNITSITRNYPTVWDSVDNVFDSLKPPVFYSNPAGSSYIDKKSIKRLFLINYEQGYKENGSSYIKKVSDSTPLYFNSIGDSWNRTYENYIPNKTLRTDYDFIDDYYHILNNNDAYPFDFGSTPSMVPIQALTNQPKNKRLNKKWEIIGFLNNNYYGEYWSTLRIPSKLSINVKSGDDILYSDLIDCIAPIDQPHDSDFITFKTDRWNTATQSVDRIEIDYLYGLQNPGTSSTDIGYITYSQTYYRDPMDVTCDGLEDDDDITTIMFKNSFGVFDIFEFEETSEFELDRKIDIFMKPKTWQDTKTSIFDSILKMDITKTYKTTTRILDDEEWVWLEELVKSNDVYVVVEGTPYPIIITNINYSSQKNVDKKITMTYRFSRPE
jgi:hypothetical protein